MTATKVIAVKTKSDQRQLAQLQVALWPELAVLDILGRVNSELQNPKQRYFIIKIGQQAVGFCQFTLRHTGVVGAKTGLVAYLNGIYVQPGQRLQHLGTQLFNAGVTWAKAQGAGQVGSDVAWDNEISQRFHESLGFQVVARLIHYLQDLGDEDNV